LRTKYHCGTDGEYRGTQVSFSRVCWKGKLAGNPEGGRMRSKNKNRLPTKKETPVSIHRKIESEESLQI